MDQPTTEDRQPTPRAARRRLTERHVLVRPSTRTEMIKAYNENYVRNLRSSGTPTRRELAEAVLQAVIEQIESPNRELATITLRAAADILRSVTEKGKSIYTNAGIKRRISAVAETLPPATSGGSYAQLEPP